MSSDAAQPMARDLIGAGMTGGVVVLDAQLRVVDLNAAAEGLLRMRPSEALGRPAEQIFAAWPQLLALLRQADQAHLELSLLGEAQRQVDLSLTPLHGASGEKIGELIVFRDVTERSRMEDGLRRSEERFHSTAEAMLDGLAIFSAIRDDAGAVVDFRYEYINEAGCRLNRRSREDHLGHTLLELFPSHAGTALLDEYIRLVESGAPVIHEAFVHEDTFGGERLTLVLNLRAVKVGDGFAVTWRNVSSLDHAVVAMQDSQTDFNRAQAVARTGSWRLDVRRNELLWSDETYRIFGIPRGRALTYETFLAAVHPEDRQAVDRAWKAALAGDAYDIEHRIFVGDEVKWVRERAELEFDDRGGLKGGFGTVQDITERKRAEEALHKAHQHATWLARFPDENPNPVLRAQPGGALLYANAPGEGLLSALGISTGDEFCLPDNLSRLVDEALHTALPTEAEVRVGGHIIALDVVPIPESGYANIYGRDITERKRAEEELRESNRRLEKALIELEEAQERVVRQERLASVGQLAAGIAHDFNNLLTPITLYGELLLQEPNLTLRGKQRIRTILEQAQHASNLTEQILDFGQRGLMRKVQVDLGSFIDDMCHLLRASFPDTISVDWARHSGACVIQADPTRLQQMVLNLANNAYHAMPKGGRLRLEVGRTRIAPDHRPTEGEIPPGDWVRLVISDSGVGISPAHLPHIFEPFFTTREVGKGSGLGLAQVYGIVHQLEGHIEVSSRIGIGTTFCLYFPVLEVEAPRAVEEAGMAPHAGKVTVLVVEDELVTRDALREILESLDYRVLTARNGRLASDIFDAEPVDLVISDLEMPDMGGAALFEALRQRRPDVKMIILTGYALGEGGRELLERGILAWVRKPLSVQDLIDTTRRALGEPLTSAQDVPRQSE